MTVNEFIKNFSHNNEIYVENKHNKEMDCIISPNRTETQIMDWYLPHSDIGECELICIKNVYRENPQGKGYINTLTFKVDTDFEEIHILPELVSFYDSPLWMYNEVHSTKIEGCCS